LVLNATSSITAASGSSAIGGSGTLRVTNGLLSTTNNSILTLAMGPGGLINVAAGATVRNGAHKNINWTNNQASMMLDGAVDMWDGQDIFIDALNGSGAVMTSDQYRGNINFTLGVANGSGTFTGQLTAPNLSVIKSGTGTQILAGTNTYTNSTTISGGTLVISGLLGNGSYAAGITNNASLVFGNSGSQTLSGAISGSGSFTMAGAGRTTLSQANSYSGGTVVSQGALVGGASTSFGSGAIVLGDGNTGTSSIVLMANTTDTTNIANAITVANLGTGLVSIGGTNTGSSSANAWTGTLTLNRNVQVFGDTTPGSSGRTSFLGQITGSGGITVTQGRVTLQNGTNNFTGPVVVNSGATLQLDVDTGRNEVIPNSAAVTVNGLLNFASRGGTETIGSLAGSGTVSSVVSGNYSLVVGGSTSTTFSGVITNGSGVIGLAKSGNGTLLLTGANGFTGGVTLNGGTLAAGSANALGSLGAISFGGGTLQYSASNTTDYSGRFSNAAGQQYSIDTNGQNVTLGSNLTSSGGSFTKLGAGGVTLSGNNSYSAGTLVSQGALIGSVSTSFGNGAIVLGDGNTGTNGIVLMANTVDNTTITNAITVANLGTGLVSIGGTNTGSSTVNAWTGTLTLNRDVQVFNDTPHAGGRTSFLGQITGSGGITVTQGRGRVTLQNTTNNFTGPVVVDSGATLQLDVAGGTNEVIPNSAAVTVNGLLNFASGGGTETIGSLSGSGTVSSFVSGTYSLVVGGSTNTTFSGVINSGSGVIGLTRSGAGTLLLTGSNGFTGGSSLNGGTLAVGSANALGSSGTISFGGGTLQYSASNTTDYSGRFSNAVGQQYSIDTNGQNVTLGSNLTSSGGSFTKSGAGAVTLTGSNGFTGGSSLNGGTLAVGSANALGSSGTISFGGGTLQYSASNTTDYSGRFSNAAGQQYSIDTNGQNVTLGSNLTSSGGSFTKLGSGSVTLSGNNSYGGGTVVSAGRLIGTTTSLQGSITNNAAVTFAQATSGTFAGAIGGAGNLVKQDTGNLILSGTSDYTGSTTVSAGRLSVNGSLGNTAVSVESGATLGGSGAIGGSVSILAGGTLSPGNSIESLAVGATTFSSVSTFAYEYDSSRLGTLGTAADLLVVNGNLAIQSGALINLTDLASSTQPFVDYTTVFALINYAGTWDGGLFTYDGTPLTNGSRFVVGNQAWQIDYNRSSAVGLDNFTGDYLPSSSFVTIAAVPEPSTCVLALAGLTCGGYLMIRRRKRA
jgi:autotransporter-associated beta strand protein